MDEEIKIDNDVPMPSNYNSKYPWKQMKVGSSFFVAARKISSINQARMNAEAATGFKFTCRTVDGGTRVWRIR